MLTRSQAAPILYAMLLVGLALPAPAKTHLTPETARIVAGNADMRAVIAEGESVDSAILAQDEKGFARTAAPEKTANAPNNRILSEGQAEKAFQLGFINYKSIDRTIEYITIRPTGEVMWMGFEVVTPTGKNHNVGSTETYRVTEIWRKIGLTWKDSVRQATISALK